MPLEIPTIQQIHIIKPRKTDRSNPPLGVKPNSNIRRIRPVRRRPAAPVLDVNQRRRNNETNDLDEDKDFSDGPGDGGRERAAVGRVVGIGGPLLRADHQGDGADPEEQQDKVDDGADDRVRRAVVLGEGVASDVAEDAVDGYEDCEERGDYWMGLLGGFGTNGKGT